MSHSASATERRRCASSSRDARLLELIETDRARQCAQILGEATRPRRGDVRTQAQCRGARAHAPAFEEQRQLRRERIAAAQARLATHRRLHEQQRTAALLRLAWRAVAGRAAGAVATSRLARAAWVAHVLASAQARMTHGAAGASCTRPTGRRRNGRRWRRRLAAESGAPPRFEADAAIDAGLKVVADGNVIDGTLGRAARRPLRGARGACCCAETGGSRVSRAQSSRRYA